MDSEWKRAAAALNAVADLLDAFTNFKDNFKASAFADALSEAQSAARALRLPNDVGRAFDRAVASSCECCFESRKQGDIFATRESAKEKKRKALERKRVARALKNALAIVACLACSVAFFFTTFQIAAIVPLAFLLYVCGFKYPVKACASVLKAFKKDASKKTV